MSACPIPLILFLIVNENNALIQHKFNPCCATNIQGLKLIEFRLSHEKLIYQ